MTIRRRNVVPIVGAANNPPLNEDEVPPVQPEVQEQQPANPVPLEGQAQAAPQVDQAEVNAALLHGLMDIWTLLGAVLQQQTPENPAASEPANPPPLPQVPPSSRGALNGTSANLPGDFAGDERYGYRHLLKKRGQAS